MPPIEHNQPVSQKRQPPCNWRDAVQLARGALAQGNQTLALELAGRADALAAQNFPRMDLRWLDVKSTLAEALAANGKLLLAAETLRQGVTIHRQLCLVDTRELIEQLFRLGEIEISAENYGEAEAVSRQIITSSQNSLHLKPADEIRGLFMLVTALMGQEKDDQAAETLVQVFAKLPQALIEVNDFKLIESAFLRAAHSMFEAGKPQESALMLEELLRLHDRHDSMAPPGKIDLGQEPDTLQIGQSLLRLLAASYLRSGDYDNALRIHKMEMASAAEPFTRLQSVMQQAHVLQIKGQADEGEYLVREELKRRQEELGSPSHPELFEWVIALGQVCLDSFKVTEAKDWAAKARCLMRPDDSGQIAELLLLEGNCFQSLHEVPQAEECFRQRVTLLTNNSNSSPAQLAVACMHLARILVLAGKTEEAEELIEQATVVFYPISRAGRNPNYAHCLKLKALTEASQGDWEQAVQHLLQARDAFVKAGGIPSADFASILLDLGTAYKHLGNIELSSDALNEAWRLASASSPIHPLLLSIASPQADNLIILGEEADAAALEQAAERIVQQLNLLNDGAIFSATEEDTDF